MSAPATETLDDGPGAAAGTHHRGDGTWRASWHGVRTVAVLELRQRVRSTRWVIVLVAWVLLLGVLTVLTRYAVHAAATPALTGDGGPTSPSDTANQYVGAALFGAIVFLVLGLGGLIAPALTSTSVNGDRAAGVLAALQTTLLTPLEIALGKLAAAWLTAMALLVAALPFVLWAYVDGGTPVSRLLTTLAVLALTLLVVCAIGLGWSSMTARPASSTALTYLTVVFLGLGLPLLFALSVPLITSTDRVRVHTAAQSDVTGDGPPPCTVVTDERQQVHTERSWWLLAANPFVVVADSAPAVRNLPGAGLDDPLTAIRDAVREARLGPTDPVEECGWFVYTPSAGTQNDPATARQQQRDALPAAWPYGLAADVALGVAFTVIAVRRLRAPARRLPRGTRVA
jgi:ABC-type transport system involved in multi-copper enzyme maturation permease subunit